MLCDRVHFTERLGIAVGHEDRVIAEAAFATRGPDERSLNTPFEQGIAAVGPDKRQCADEMGVA